MTDPALTLPAATPADLPSVGPVAWARDPAELRWAYAIAASMTLASLFAAINPAFGAYVAAWPWEVRPGAWTADTATTFAFGAATLLAWACVFLAPGLVRGSVAAVGCILCVVAMHRSSSAFSVAGYVPPLVAATLGGTLCAGLSARARGAGRRAAVVGALVLAALLLFPLPSSAQPGLERAYRSWATRTVDDVQALAAADPGHLRRYLMSPTTVLTGGYALLALLGLVAATTRSKTVRWVGVATFAATWAWVFGFPLVDGWIEPEFHVGGGAEWEGLPPAQVALRRAAGALLVYYVAPAAAVFAATTDFLRATPAAAAAEGSAVRVER